MIAARNEIELLRQELEAAEAAAAAPADAAAGGMSLIQATANAALAAARQAMTRRIPGATGEELRTNLAGAVQEARKLDAVLRGSAEAMFRIGEYVEKIWSPTVVSVTPAVAGMPPRPGMPPDVPRGVPPPRMPPPPGGGVPEANPQLVRLIEILTQVEINTRPGFLGRIGLT